MKELSMLYAEKCAELGNTKARLALLQQSIMAIIDEVDGQIMDDPVSEIRERLERLSW